jgi:diacylglycerol kinase family enzyme
MKLALILNPNSRYNKRHPESIARYCNLGGSRVDLFRTESADDVTVVAQKIKDKDVSFIGISGGDGTIHQVLTHVIQVYGSTLIPPVILLGDGTMNNIAHSLGIKMKGFPCLKRFLRNMEEEKLTIRERSTIKIEDRYCFLFGCGVITNFLNEAYTGRKGYLRNLEVLQRTLNDIIASAIFGRKESKLLKPLRGKLICDGMNIPLQHLRFVLAGTVEEVGMGFRPLYMADEKKNHFHLIATDLGPYEVLFRLCMAGAGMGSLIHNPHFYNRVTAEMLIRSPDRFDYTMDGDIYTADKDLYIESGPSIRFVIV